MLKSLQQNPTKIGNNTLPVNAEIVLSSTMEDSDRLGPHELELQPPHDVNTDTATYGHNDVESSVGENPGDVISASTTAAATNLQSNLPAFITKENSRSASATSRQRGRPGRKWVKGNHESMERLATENSKYLTAILVPISYASTDGIMPDLEADRTSSFPNSDKWSKDNLPEILLYIIPPVSEYEGQPVGFIQENGRAVKIGEHGKPLRDFPILPRHISCNVEGWLVEAWRLIDPRITYADILDRQTEDHVNRIFKLDKNALQNRCRRECRMALGSWTSSSERRNDPYRADVETIEKLSYQNITLNTILNVCPIRQDRLTKVRLVTRSPDGKGKLVAEPCEVNATNVYETTFPIDHFVLKSEVSADGLHSMDDSMMAAWELSLILQERGRLHMASHWSKLPDQCKPPAWFERTTNKRVDNGTFDGGCPVCTWVPGRDQILHKAWIDEVRSACSKPTTRKTAAKSGSSSTSSKRRKLADGKSQAVSADRADEASKDCQCCKEAESVHNFGTSAQVELGEIKSYFRDPDRIEEAQTNSQAGSNKGCVTADKGGRRNMIEQKGKQGVELGSGAGEQDWESQVVSCARPSRCVLEVALANGSVFRQASSSQMRPASSERRSRFLDSEKDLQGVGSHLPMYGGEHLLKHTQDEAAGAALELPVAERIEANWPAINVSPPENFGANWTQEDDLDALWRLNPGIAPSMGNDASIQIGAFNQASYQNQFEIPDDPASAYPPIDTGMDQLPFSWSDWQ
jgi:hypothetical protein